MLNYLLNFYGAGNSKEILLKDSDLNKLEQLILETPPISSEVESTLMGIDNFSFLEDLEIPNQRIDSLKNISKLTHLRYLRCQNNNIADLTPLYRMTNLEALFINNQRDNSGHVELLKNLNLDFSDNYKLKTLNVSNNSINSLKVGYNLIDLDCSNNNLITLSTEKLLKLETLFCYNNKILELNLQNNLGLNNLHCKNNQLLFLNLSESHPYKVDSLEQKKTVSIVKNSFQIKGKNFIPQNILFSDTDNLKYDKDHGIFTFLKGKPDTGTFSYKYKTGGRTLSNQDIFLPVTINYDSRIPLNTNEYIADSFLRAQLSSNIAPIDPNYLDKQSLENFKSSNQYLSISGQVKTLQGLDLISNYISKIELGGFSSEIRTIDLREMDSLKELRIGKYYNAIESTDFILPTQQKIIISQASSPMRLQYLNINSNVDFEKGFNFVSEIKLPYNTTEVYLGNNFKINQLDNAGITQDSKRLNPIQETISINSMGGPVSYRYGVYSELSTPSSQKYLLVRLIPRFSLTKEEWIGASPESVGQLVPDQELRKYIWDSLNSETITTENLSSILNLTIKQDKFYNIESLIGLSKFKKISNLDLTRTGITIKSLIDNYLDKELQNVPSNLYLWNDIPDSRYKNQFLYIKDFLAGNLGYTKRILNTPFSVTVDYKNYDNDVINIPLIEKVDLSSNIFPIKNLSLVNCLSPDCDIRDIPSTLISLSLAKNNLRQECLDLSNLQDLLTLDCSQNQFMYIKCHEKANISAINLQESVIYLPEGSEKIILPDSLDIKRISGEIINFVREDPETNTEVSHSEPIPLSKEIFFPPTEKSYLYYTYIPSQGPYKLTVKLMIQPHIYTINDFQENNILWNYLLKYYYKTLTPAKDTIPQELIYNSSGVLNLTRNYNKEKLAWDVEEGIKNLRGIEKVPYLNHLVLKNQPFSIHSDEPKDLEAFLKITNCSNLEIVYDTPDLLPVTGEKIYGFIPIDEIVNYENPSNKNLKRNFVFKNYNNLGISLQVLNFVSQNIQSMQLSGIDQVKEINFSNSLNLEVIDIQNMKSLRKISYSFSPDKKRTYKTLKTLKCSQCELFELNDFFDEQGLENIYVDRNHLLYFNLNPNIKKLESLRMNNSSYQTREIKNGFYPLIFPIDFKIQNLEPSLKDKRGVIDIPYSEIEEKHGYFGIKNGIPQKDGIFIDWIKSIGNSIETDKPIYSLNSTIFSQYDAFQYEYDIAANAVKNYQDGLDTGNYMGTRMKVRLLLNNDVFVVENSNNRKYVQEMFDPIVLKSIKDTYCYIDSTDSSQYLLKKDNIVSIVEIGDTKTPQVSQTISFNNLNIFLNQYYSANKGNFRGIKINRHCQKRDIKKYRENLLTKEKEIIYLPEDFILKKLTNIYVSGELLQQENNWVFNSENNTLEILKVQSSGINANKKNSTIEFQFKATDAPDNYKDCFVDPNKIYSLILE